MSSDWDRPSRPKGACDACGRVAGVVMGDRGPVKVSLDMKDVGHFRFCTECLAGSERTSQPSGALLLDVLYVHNGPSAGHRWITSVSDR